MSETQACGSCSSAAASPETASPDRGSASKRRAGAPKPLNPDALAHIPKQRVTPPPVQNTTAAVGAPNTSENSAPHATITAAPPPTTTTNAVPFPVPFQWGVQTATAMTDAEFVLTRSMIAHMQQPALVTVLQSLMDDFPQLAPLIRIRCETAMHYLMGQVGPAKVSPLFAAAPATAAPTFAAKYVMTPLAGQVHSATATSSTRGAGPGSTTAFGAGHDGAAGGTPTQWNERTPPGQPHRQAKAPATAARRGGKEDETEVCAVHGNPRALKHLHYNTVAGKWECIPGFHCLEGQGISPVPSPYSQKTTPQKKPEAPTVRTSPPPAPSLSEAAGKREPDGKELMTVQHLENLLNAIRRQQEETAGPPSEGGDHVNPTM